MSPIPRNIDFDRNEGGFPLLFIAIEWTFYWKFADW